MRVYDTRAADVSAFTIPAGGGGAVPATATQVGGNHYKDMAIQPIEYILGNGIGYAEGAVIKYVSRWQNKGGVDDLKKAKHFLELLIEHVEGKK